MAGMPRPPDAPLGRREFLTRASAAAAALGAGCRSRAGAGGLVLRLSHSMASGMTALHALADTFRELAEAASEGAIRIRVFPSGTLGQEREVVQQLQEGLVDFMVSGSAIWGSVAPRVQVLDFPFLWRDAAHVHRMVDGPLGREVADYLADAVHIRPLAWGDSFGFRQVITRSRDVSEPGQLAGLKIRTIQSPIYVKAVQLMGASPTPMSFGEVYTSLQVVGRHLLRQPVPWTEEVARLLLVWLMCVGGIRALQRAEHPRVTALLRLVSEARRQAVDRGMRLVLLGFFLCLIVPASRLTVASAGERLPASGLSGAAISAVLPVALALMSLVLVHQLHHEGVAVWRDTKSLTWSVGAASLALASVLVPLLAGAAPLLVLSMGFLVTAALGLPLAFTLALTSLTYLLGIGGVSLVILPIKILGGVDSFVLLAIPLFILAGALMESGGISERIVDLAMAIVDASAAASPWSWWWPRSCSPASPDRRRPTCRRSVPCSSPRCEEPATRDPSPSAWWLPLPPWASSSPLA